MEFYLKKANFKFLIDLYNNRYNKLISDTIEQRLSDYFQNLSFTQKIKILTKTILIMNKTKVIGFILCDSLKDYIIYVKEISISKDYINNSKSNSLKQYPFLKNKILYYDGFENSDLTLTINQLGFLLKSKSVLKSMDLTQFDSSSIKNNDDLNIVNFIENKDEFLRCELQNNIFQEDSRVPLSVNDIYYDQMQEYYLKDYSFFLKYKDKSIGYAQVIKFNKSYLIVNLGIVQNFRGNGLGEYLLNQLLIILKSRNIEKIFIRVDIKNTIACSLYDKVGFIDEQIINSYRSQ